MLDPAARLIDADRTRRCRQDPARRRRSRRISTRASTKSRSSTSRPSATTTGSCRGSPSRSASRSPLASPPPHSSALSVSGNCCWCWTTSSTSSRPGRFWSISWAAAQASRCWSPAGRCCGSPASTSSPFRRWPSLTLSRRRRPERWPGTTAVRLFVERSAAVSPAFALTEENATTVARICQGLDGLPLAIELAAARMTVLTPQALLAPARPAARAAHRRRARRPGTAADHASRDRVELRPALAPEQALFQRLAVFAGGFGLAAAEFVVSRETILVHRHARRSRRPEPGAADHSGRRRSALRHAGDDRRVRLGTARGQRRRAGRPGAATPTASAGSRRAPSQACAGRTSRSGGTGWKPTSTTCGPRWTGARALPRRTRTPRYGLRLAGALWYFWFQRGLPGEGRRWLTRALAGVRTARTRSRPGAARRGHAGLAAGRLRSRTGPPGRQRRTVAGRRHRPPRPRRGPARPGTCGVRPAGLRGGPGAVREEPGNVPTGGGHAGKPAV